MYTFQQLNSARVAKGRWPRGTTPSYLTALFESMDRELGPETRERFPTLSAINVAALGALIREKGRTVMLTPPAVDSAQVVAFALIRHWHNLPLVSRATFKPKHVGVQPC